MRAGSGTAGMWAVGGGAAGKARGCPLRGGAGSGARGADGSEAGASEGVPRWVVEWIASESR